MTAKEYLSQLQVLDTKINQKIAERDRLRSIVAGRGMSYDGVSVQTSPENKQEATIIKYLEIEERISKMIDEYMARMDMIINQIHELGDDRYIQILHLRYVPDDRHRVKRLEDIAELMHKSTGEPYSYDRINHLHGEALQAFEKKFLK